MVQRRYATRPAYGTSLSLVASATITGSKNFVPGNVLRVYLDYLIKAPPNHEIVIVINPIRQMPPMGIRQTDLSCVIQSQWLSWCG